MKFVFISLLSSIAFLHSTIVFSQCAPDESYIPVNANYGLIPDSLGNGVFGQPYFQELTFYLPLDTLVEVDGFGENLIYFEDYHITSISLPIGMSWECNNFENQCHYDPIVSQYGCVIIDGTPLEFGDFEVEVTVVATHNLSWLVGTEIISFVLPLTILPNISNNNGFSMTNFSGCAPLTVEFINNNPGLSSYSWNFGNGNQNNSENPQNQLYTDVGTYVVNYQAYSTSESIYTLESVTINASENWQDFDDGTSFTPDHYFYILNQQGNVVYSSVVQDNVSLPAEFTDIGFLLQDDTYFIEVWDDDTYYALGLELGTDDNLGSLEFNTNSSNISDNGLSISLSINEIPPIPFQEITDTIYVYENPQPTDIVYDDMSNQLSLNTDSQNVEYQWYYSQSPISEATEVSFLPENTGFYSLLATNEFGCVSLSNEELVVLCSNEFTPEISFTDDTLFSVSYLFLEYQWLLNNEIIIGANENFYLPTEQGTYSLSLFDEWGCEYRSNEIIYNLSDLDQIFSQNLLVYPNPSNGRVTLSIDKNFNQAIVEVFNLHGKKVFNKLLYENYSSLDLQELPKGIYYLSVQIDNKYLNTKLIID